MRHYRQHGKHKLGPVVNEFHDADGGPQPLDWLVFLGASVLGWVLVALLIWTSYGLARFIFG